MPRIEVNGVDIAYELIGNGTPIVWTNGGFLPRGNLCYLVAGRFCSKHQVFIWDRRNCGEADIALDESQPSEFHAYAHDLHEILHALDLAPAIVGGGSGGYITSVLFAHLYPDDVKGLILCAPPTIDKERLEGLIQSHYLDHADLAETKGMQAVVESSGGLYTWSSLCERNPENVDRLVSMDPENFAALMRKWAEWGPFWSAGLSDVELSQIRIAAVITPGIDDVNGLHPWQPATELHKRLPISEFVDWKTLIGDHKWRQLQEGVISEPECFAPVFDVWDRFIEKVEMG
jgi:pimeloyl-ACP methyl ester carboxylesterase